MWGGGQSILWKFESFSGKLWTWHVPSPPPQAEFPLLEDEGNMTSQRAA